MKPYMVEITTYGVVMAEDEAHAHQVADSYKREIFGDDWNPRIEVDGAVVKVEDLAHGWDGECIPYGGDGNTKLADLLVPNYKWTPQKASCFTPHGCLTFSKSRLHKGSRPCQTF